MYAIVKRRKLDDKVKVVGNMNNNPLFDTRAYEVEYADSTTEVITYDIISKNLLAQVDEEGHRQMILDYIIYHIQYINAIGKKDVFAKTPNGTKGMKTTTAGWQI